jgi:hypothetical protein
MSIVDRFLYKLAIMMFFLLAFVTLDKFKIVKIENVQNKINHNFNIIKFINTLNGKTNLITINFQDVTSANTNAYKIKKLPQGTRIILDDYEAIEALTLGMVVKIDGNDVYILDSNDYLYCYKNVNNLDVNIYQIIRKNQIIGRANVEEGVNYFDVYVTKNNQYVNLIK